MASSTLASVPAAGLRRIPQPLRRATTVLAALFLAAMIVMAVFADRLAPQGYSVQNRSEAFSGPGPKHPLGTDNLGRDVLSRVMYGARISLTVAIVVELVELFFGLSLGMLAGLKGGRLDNAVMRLTDLMFAFPDILLAILLVGTLGKSIQNVLIALALVQWPGMVRLVRSQVLSLRSKEYVEAARVLGATDLRLMLRHLLPNLVGPVIVAATVGMGAIILAESTLSFLGLGIQDPFPSWGKMIRDGWEHRRSDVMLTVYPALFLAGTIMAFNFLGDGLRDWLDPRSRSV